jgi:hypothetical protein
MSTPTLNASLADPLTGGGARGAAARSMRSTTAHREAVRRSGLPGVSWSAEPAQHLPIGSGMPAMVTADVEDTSGPDAAGL